MRIIAIEALPNGAHFNQTSDISKIPKGYAQIPDDMPIPDTFPFVNIEVAEETRYNEVKHSNEETDEETVERIPYTVVVVTSMTAGVMPEPAPIPESTGKELTVDDMANAILEGVNDI
ncbi:MAG: hypothetical protein IJP16_04935 [Clostridia bacterium]|nr:hypothetical protein [Clostridia bacterium]